MRPVTRAPALDLDSGVKDAALDLGARLDRDGGSKNAAIQPSGDDDLRAMMSPSTYPPGGDNQPERCDAASHVA